MDIHGQINISPNNTEPLGSIKAVFYQYYEQLVDDCCMRVDLEFGLQLGKDREKAGKENYKKLLEYLRSVRKEIKQDYLFKVNAAFDNSGQKTVHNLNGKFDFSAAALTSDDVVEEDYAVAMIIRNCQHLVHQELNSLNKRLATLQGKHVIADHQNPVSPEKLVRALVDVIKPLKLNTDYRIALYKSFEVNVFRQLGFVYHELIKQCDAGAITRILDVKQRSQLAEENVVQLIGSKEVQVSNKKAVAMAIEDSMQGKELPATIAEFLRNVWQDVLLAAYERKDEVPEPWQKAVQVMDELIVSVIPPTDDAERKRILKFLPGLIKELRVGLKQISCDKSAQAHFFKDLAVWHIILMNKKTVAPVNKAEMTAEVIVG